MPLFERILQEFPGTDDVKLFFRNRLDGEVFPSPFLFLQSVKIADKRYITRYAIPKHQIYY